MPNYFDPIMQEDTVLDESTIVYLVKIGADKFSIKGVSSGLEKLPSDPTTHANEYWPIPVATLMSQASNKALFNEDKLTSESLTKEQVIEFFNVDPDKVAPTQFNRSIKQELIDTWSEQTVRDMFAEAMPNPHSFFMQPILLRRRHENGNSHEEDHEEQIIPAFIMFQMVEQSSDDDEAPGQLLINMFVVAMNQEPDADEEDEMDASTGLNH
jgi:hypothetical protein